MGNSGTLIRMLSLGVVQRSTASCLRLVALMLAIMPAAHIAHADVVLVGGKITGQVGLSGETFATGSLYASWSGGNSSVALTNGDTSYTIGVGAGVPVTLYYYLNSFQNTSNAQLFGQRSNIPALAADETRTVDLMRPAGRIRRCHRRHGRADPNVDVVVSVAGRIFQGNCHHDWRYQRDPTDAGSFEHGGERHRHAACRRRMRCAGHPGAAQATSVSK